VTLQNDGLNLKVMTSRYSGLLKFAKLTERAKNAASFGHSNAENLSTLGNFAP